MDINEEICIRYNSYFWVEKKNHFLYNACIRPIKPKKNCPINKPSFLVYKLFQFFSRVKGLKFLNYMIIKAKNFCVYFPTNAYDMAFNDIK